MFLDVHASKASAAKLIFGTHQLGLGSVEPLNEAILPTWVDPQSDERDERSE